MAERAQLPAAELLTGSRRTGTRDWHWFCPRTGCDRHYVQEEGARCECDALGSAEEGGAHCRLCCPGEVAATVLASDGESGDGELCQSCCSDGGGTTLSDYSEYSDDDDGGPVLETQEEEPPPATEPAEEPPAAQPETQPQQQPPPRAAGDDDDTSPAAGPAVAGMGVARGACDGTHTLDEPHGLQASPRRSPRFARAPARRLDCRGLGRDDHALHGCFGAEE